MDEKKGIKNLKEVINLAFIIVILILKEIKKDGFQISDLFVFLASPDFQAAVTPAMNEITEIPSEVTDLDVNEGFELGVSAIFYIKQIVEIYKK